MARSWIAVGVLSALGCLLASCAAPRAQISQSELDSLAETECIVWGYFDTSVISFFRRDANSGELHEETGVEYSRGLLWYLFPFSLFTPEIELRFILADTQEEFAVELPTARSWWPFAIVLPEGEYSLVSVLDFAEMHHGAIAASSIKCAGGGKAVYVGDLYAAVIDETEPVLFDVGDFEGRVTEFLVSNPAFNGVIVESRAAPRLALQQ